MTLFDPSHFGCLHRRQVFVRIRDREGVEIGRFTCLDCTNPIGPPVAPEDVARFIEMYEAFPDQYEVKYVDHIRICTVRDCFRTDGVEAHHIYERAVDPAIAEQYPTVDLCRPHHLKLTQDHLTYHSGPRALARAGKAIIAPMVRELRRQLLSARQQLAAKDRQLDAAKRELRQVLELLASDDDAQG